MLSNSCFYTLNLSKIFQHSLVFEIKILIFRIAYFSTKFLR